MTPTRGMPGMPSKTLSPFDIGQARLVELTDSADHGIGPHAAPLPALHDVQLPQALGLVVAHGQHFGAQLHML